jgi:hypothetical protein
MFRGKMRPMMHDRNDKRQMGGVEMGDDDDDVDDDDGRGDGSRRPV